MSDERELEMLELMRECSMTLRRCENKLNEIWAEWTRTHGLKIPGKERPEEVTVRSKDGKIVRRISSKRG